MIKTGGALLVFLAGFAVMVLEVAGARYLTKDFGSSFYVWISQIGVVLVALALGYGVGGILADRFQGSGALCPLLAGAGIITILIPDFTPKFVNLISMRHPLDQPIPLIWQKLDPVFGSTLVFFLPCCVLAMVTPFVIRLTARRLERVGTISGLAYAASTTGSIAGVFVSGYLLIEWLPMSLIFRATGILMVLLGGLSLALDRWIGSPKEN